MDACNHDHQKRSLYVITALHTVYNYKYYDQLCAHSYPRSSSLLAQPLTGGITACFPCSISLTNFLAHNPTAPGPCGASRGPGRGSRPRQARRAPTGSAAWTWRPRRGTRRSPATSCPRRPAPGRPRRSGGSSSRRLQGLPTRSHHS